MEAHAVQEPHVQVVHQRQHVHGNVCKQLGLVEKLFPPFCLPSIPARNCTPTECVRAIQ
jgi:hypothetical protein